MSTRNRIALLLAVLSLVIAGCGIPQTDAQNDAPAQGSAKDCPVTIPPQPGFLASEPENVTYTKHFPAPDPWPTEYPHQDKVWYGSEELWTALDVDGDHGGRKSVWWSANYPGGTEEESPGVRVTWTRLDSDEPVLIDNDGIATNAHTSSEGWFMIAGIDPDQPGCWQVEASYKDATLGYVYELPRR